MRIKRFSTIENHQELQQLNSEKIDFLKGKVLIDLVTMGEVSQDLTRSFYQDILGKRD